MSSFRDELAVFAQKGITRVAECKNEECTKMFLVQPFLMLLGYNPHDPNHVTAEHAADFADKYRNRVDYLLKANGGSNAIALECKPCGTDLYECRGQLRRYFSALPGSKVGAITNGLEYEFFIDSVETNRMDEEPFLHLSLKSLAKGTARVDEIEFLENLSRERFNAESIALRARRRLLKEDLVRQFVDELKSPSEELCRLFLQRANRTYVRSSQIKTIYRGVMKGAIEEALARQLWDRLQKQHQLDVEVRAEEIVPSEIETTDRELYVFGYCRRRLAFLVQDDSLFREIEKIGHRDFATKFGVYYDRVRQGRLFDFYEGEERDRFVFPNDLGEYEVADDLEKLDQPLLTIFMAKVKELRGF